MTLPEVYHCQAKIRFSFLAKICHFAETMCKMSLVTKEDSRLKPEVFSYKDLREMPIADVLDIQCTVGIPPGKPLPMPEDEFKAHLSRVLSPFLGAVSEARLFFGMPIEKICFIMAEAAPFNLLGNAVEDGFNIFINPKNKILDYNAITYAIIFHEYAHWIDLTARGRRDRLQPLTTDELLSRRDDPSWCGEWLYDEYRANSLLPYDIIKDLKLIAAANLLGRDGDEFFSRMERAYPRLVYAQISQSFANLVDNYLPIYLNEVEKQKRIFLALLQNSYKQCHKKWLSVCYNILHAKPVYKPAFPHEEILLAVAGYQLEPKEDYKFIAGISPIPMTFIGKADWSWMDHITSTLRASGIEISA